MRMRSKAPVSDGQLHLDLWASDLFLSNVGFRFGSHTVYTLLSFGTQPALANARSRSGLTLGVAFYRLWPGFFAGVQF